MGVEKIVEIIRWFAPPERWRVPVIILLGILVGLGIHLIHISKAASYLSDSPRTCINCHIMNPQFATWERGSHGRVANCNDCHVPHDNFFHTYYFKAQDGIRHASIFTLRREPQVIQIKEAGKKAVQGNCVRCHSNSIHPVALRALNQRSVEDQTEKYCWDCHRETPHGRVNSLSAAPYARISAESPSIPDWIEKSRRSAEDYRANPTEKGM